MMKPKLYAHMDVNYLIQILVHINLLIEIYVKKIEKMEFKKFQNIFSYF